ncbi:MAG TPA: NAD(P)-dependent oxidoreductase [Candidatus Saccharimonadales bacterium]|nr:NAD(P)-dependent oxidoreductase [Candidatus Saccharimonadales bacterium]
MATILITDSLFIFDEHEKKLKDAGFEIERLDKPDATENELIKAVKGKAGYILGGVEYITEPVINAADKLQAIIFTGTGYQGHIPAWKEAQAKGIKIGTTPYANVYEVAEWALAATLAMQRDLFSLGPKGADKFHTITSLPDLRIGVIGLGHIGNKYADMMSGLGANEVVYWSRQQKNVKYKYLDMEEVFKTSDIVFVALGDEAGQNFISAKQLSLMKKDALLVCISHDGIVNEEALSKALKAESIRAAFDIIKNHELFKGISPRYWYGSNSSAAYNSIGYLKRSSDMAVKTLLNLLETGEDQYKVV